MARASVRVTSEIGPLEAVICHTPGPELRAVTPATREDFLYDDIIDVGHARREHGRFTQVLSRFCEVYEIRSLLEDVADRPEVRPFLVERALEVTRSEPLAEMLPELSAPELAGLFVEGSTARPGPLQRLLNVENYDLPPLPNLFFTRDAAMVAGEGVVVGAMRYRVRWTEGILMKTLFSYHPLLRNAGYIYDGTRERRTGHTLEGGDLHVLRPDTVLLGLSERSSPGAFDAMARQLTERAGIEHVLVVVLPTNRAMIHLDMVFTMVDRDHCVVFEPLFSGPARAPVLHYRAGGHGLRERPDLFTALRELGLPLEPVRCGGERRRDQEREQWSSGCNFVALRPGLIVGYARNEQTYRELEREAGYRVVAAGDFLDGKDRIGDDDKAAVVFEGAELVRGGGGPRCMTLPVRRADSW